MLQQILQVFILGNQIIDADKLEHLISQSGLETQDDRYDRNRLIPTF